MFAGGGARGGGGRSRTGKLARRTAMNIQAHGTQWVTVAVSLLLGIGLLTGTANADVKTVKVDCVKGQTIAKALEREDERKPLIVIVQGTCNENVVMTRDDVTLQGDAAAGGAVVGVDPAQATVQIDGGRGGVLEHLSVSRGGGGTRAPPGGAMASSLLAGRHLTCATAPFRATGELGWS